MDLSRFTRKVGVLLCTDGEMNITIGAKMWCIRQGDALIITPILIYDKAVETADFTYMTLLIDFNVFYDVARIIFNITLPLYILRNPILHLDAEQQERLTRRIREIRHEQELATSPDINPVLCKIHATAVERLSQSSILELLGYEFGNHQNQIFKAEGQDVRNSIVVVNFLLAIIQNYRTERRVTFYADKANLSTSHFSFLIRKETGHSPLYWISFITINNAKILLRTNNKTIKEIADELGFPEQFTFRKYFKTYTGMSPSEFRH